MGAVGFEPTKAEPSDLQSDPFGHFGTRPKLTPPKWPFGGAKIMDDPTPEFKSPLMLIPPRWRMRAL